jgi:predicted RNA polymerase sigma factor
VGNQVTAYHIEAAIASYYCHSPSFNQTDWPAILQLYTLLAGLNPSPIVTLNMAIAMAYGGDVAKAIDIVLAIPQLKKNHLYQATLGDLYALLGNNEKACQYYKNALLITNNIEEKKLFEKKIINLN